MAFGAPVARPPRSASRRSLSALPVNVPAVARLWNEDIARHHSLGYTRDSGSRTRFEIFANLLCVASKILSLIVRQLPRDWQQRCVYRHVLPKNFR